MTRAADLETIGGRIRHLREVKGWSQQRLAAELDTSQVSVSHWERNAFTPRRAAQAALVDVLGASFEYLFEADDTRRAEQRRGAVRKSKRAAAAIERRAVNLARKAVDA